jgi:hypothetical protein
MHPSQEQRLAIYEEFAQRISALAPAAWDRIAARSTALEGDSFAALYRRAKVFTGPAGAPLRNLARTGGPRVVGAVGDAVLTAIGVVRELAREFETPDPSFPNRMESAAHAATDSQVRQFLLAEAKLERTLAPYDASRPGMTAAVRAAAHAAMQFDLLTQDELTRLYGPMEPEVPLAELRHAAAAAADPV